MPRRDRHHCCRCLRDADRHALPDVAAPEPIEIEPLVPELVVPELNTSTPLVIAPAFVDRDRAARRGDALTTAHTHSAARVYRALSGCHRQQTACPLSPLPTVMLITPALPMSPHQSRSRSSR